MAEEALHCAEVEGLNIAVQLYQPRRPTHSVREFNAAAPSFVPAPISFSPFHPQVTICSLSFFLPISHQVLYSILHLHVHNLTRQFDRLSRYPRLRLSTDQARRFN
jgi:polyadenylate-binding protein